MPGGIIQPVVVNPETLATEIIKKVGPSGTFMTEKHTRKHFREFWYSDFSRPQPS